MRNDGTNDWPATSHPLVSSSLILLTYARSNLRSISRFEIETIIGWPWGQM